MKRTSEGRVDRRVAHAFRFVDKDVRRFFQSPVDAAPGTVDAQIRELMWAVVLDDNSSPGQHQIRHG